MSEAVRVEVTEVRVPFRDIDMYGKLHTAAYISHAEGALGHFWGYRPALEEEPLFMVTKIECRFFRALRLGDLARFTVQIDKIGGKSVGFNVLIETGNAVSAEIEMVWTATERETGEPVALPEEIRDWLYRYLN